MTHLSATSQEILLYPHPNLRIRHKAGHPAEGVVAYLHADQPGSVRMVTDDAPDADGSMVARETTYRPFGKAVEFAVSRTGLKQPMRGVGTNRYAYSFNDPVNGRDPGGNVRILL